MENFKVGITTSFYRWGSTRENRFQDKLPEGIQLEMGLNTVGLELSTLYELEGKSIFFGFGLVHHRILDYDYKIVDNTISVGTDPRMLDATAIRSSLNNLKFFVGWRFSTVYRFKIAYESSMTDILDENFFNIARLRPYMLTFTFAYEFNPGIKKKSKGKKARKPRKK